MSTEHITLGNALIAIEDPQFLEGYTCGFRHYCRYDFTTPLTDTVVKRLLEQPFSTHSAMWRAGFLMGWLTAVHGIPRLRPFCKLVRHRWQHKEGMGECDNDVHAVGEHHAERSAHS